MSDSISFARPQDLQRADLIDESPGSAFDQLLKKHKLNEQEYARLRDIQGRAPTMSEMGVFSSMWSEHCSYKSSRIHLGRFPTTGSQVVQGPGENAGVVRLSGKLCAAFKMESHNHPSYIEPYQGAATGVGGILRDVFCMGARPVANLNALRFGSRDHERTPYLFEHVVKGIGDYGNCIGVPTVGGNVSFDPTYDGNCLVNAMTVGLIHEDRIFKGYASGVGNLVVYVGSATGRDGIHGATMASDSFATAESSERSTVQVGDPFTEKLLLEATLEVLDKGLVVGLQDMGAAGLTSSSFEMADRARSGLLLDLDRVPVRTTAMTAYELLLSESQERMLMVIEPAHWDALSEVLNRWGLANAIIGQVTNTGRVEAIKEGRLEVDIPVSPIGEAAPKYDRPQRPRPEAKDTKGFDHVIESRIHEVGALELALDMLADTGSKEAIFKQYDHHIGTSTVRSSAEGGAAVQWIRSDWSDPSDEYLGLLSAAACNERYCRLAPRQGAAHAVVKAARMIFAAGGTPLAITDCLNYGNPEDPQVMWEFSQGVDGISEACLALNAPVVSGNVSLYNETDGKSIAPTPMIGMVGKTSDVRTAPRAVLSREGSVYALRPKSQSGKFGASLAAKALGFHDRQGELPALDYRLELAAGALLQAWTKKNQLTFARDIGDGGLLLTLMKAALPADFGISDGLDDTPEFLFGERSAAYLVQFSDEQTALAAQSDLPADLELIKIGVCQRQSGFSFRHVNIDQNLAKTAFTSPDKVQSL